MSVDLFILDWLSRIVECLVRCGISCVCVLFGVFFIDSLSMLQLSVWYGVRCLCVIGSVVLMLILFSMMSGFSLFVLVVISVWLSRFLLKQGLVVSMISNWLRFVVNSFDLNWLEWYSRLCCLLIFMIMFWLVDVSLYVMWLLIVMLFFLLCGKYCSIGLLLLGVMMQWWLCVVIMWFLVCCVFDVCGVGLWEVGWFMCVVVGG